MKGDDSNRLKLPISEDSLPRGECTGHRPKKTCDFTAFLSVDGKDRVVRQRKELKIVAEVCREMILLLLWLWVLLVQM